MADPLLIVESPAKARTIAKFLGRGFEVEASIGHVRDLPKGAKEIPEQYKGEDWSHLGVDVNNNFMPVYVVPPLPLTDAGCQTIGPGSVAHRSPREEDLRVRPCGACSQ